MLHNDIAAAAAIIDATFFSGKSFFFQTKVNCQQVQSKTFLSSKKGGKGRKRDGRGQGSSSPDSPERALMTQRKTPSTISSVWVGDTDAN